MQLTIPRKAPGTDASQVGGELVILDAEGRVLRGLNPVGARVWELIDGVRSVSEIAAVIAAEFDVTPGRALQDVAPFIALLEHKRLLQAR